MSAFGVIKHLTDALVFGLDAAFAADPLTAAFSGMIFTDSPAEAGSGVNQKTGMSFWPYRVQRDEFQSDPSLVPIGPSLLGIPPLRVDVWYMVTPMTGSGDSDQLLLEKTLQYIYDVGPIALGEDTPIVTFETPGADELFRLWSALNIPYALSSVFTARHVSIDSLRSPQGSGRIVERYDRYVRIG
ncbi:MAG TPA: Pvc16 family protein [Candidatus Acidoferrales bacterium]|nr:Pvc16 family protein [Candidatus Acidoferrales bacterium]